MTTTARQNHELAIADLQAGRVTETAKIVAVTEAQYQIDEYDIGQNEAAENIADAWGVPFRVVLDAIAGRVRD
jgi:hypothetical protein